VHRFTRYPFDRLADLETARGRPDSTSSFEQSLDEPTDDERTHGIVDHDPPGVGGYGLEPAPDRFLARGTSFDDVDRSIETMPAQDTKRGFHAIGGHSQHCSLDSSTAQQSP